MAELTFIGLANYKPSDKNLVNIIFTSNSSDKTTYQYNFSASLALPTSGWTNIPTLTDVTIPAGREISAQLDTPYNNNTLYYLYITESNSINTIWQESMTTAIAPETDISINNYTDYVHSYPTLAGGSIYNNNDPKSYTITSNIIYTADTASINITDTYNNVDNIPIFIMSNGHISIENNLTTTNGSINIVGTRTVAKSAGIHIEYNNFPNTIIDITGNVTLNGNGTGINGKGVHIKSPINITGNVTLNGMGAGVVGIYIEAAITNSGNVTLYGAGWYGIIIDTAITNTSTGNVTLNGAGTYGIIIDAAITNDGTGNVTLYGAGTYGIIIGAYITNDGTGNVTLNGTGTYGIYIDASITISGTVTLYGTGSYGIYINTGANIINNGIGNVILNGTATYGTGIYINTGANITNDGIGNVTLNGTGGKDGINIVATITITGNVALYGKGTQDGIYIGASITNNGIGTVTLNGTGGAYGIYIVATITNTSTGNVILNGAGAYGIYIGGDITNDGIGNVTLIGSATTGYGIDITGNNINLKNIILNGTSNGTGINIDSNIIIIGTVIITGTSNADGNGINIGEDITASGANKLSLTGISSSSSDGGGVGIFIATAISTISGNITLNGKSLYTNGVLIDGNLSITGNVVFIITITNSIVPYIEYYTGTLTGLINIVIDPSSNLSVPANYNLLENIPSNNIGIMSGLFNTIRWNIISTSSNNWALVTVESKLVNGDISGGNIVIDNKYYKLSQNGNITFKLILQDVSFILEIQSILVTSSKNGTILYISDNNIITVIATGLYGITTIMQDDNKNIYYTIISQKLFYIYKLGHPKELLQGRGENIQIFYSNGNMILVNTDTNKIFIYKFVTDIKLNFIYSKDVSNLGIITNIINNKGTLLFLFNNNTIYKFNLYSMIQIYFTNINYAGIAVSNNILYGIINNGGILSSEKLLSGSIISLLL